MSQTTISFNNWMGANWNLLSNKRLCDLYLPGAHDSSCNKYNYSVRSQVTTTVSKLPMRLLNILTLGILESVINDWGISQYGDIYFQLNSGIRYLDFRITFDKDGIIRMHHTWITCLLDEGIAQVKKFLSENTNECIFIYAKIDYMTTVTDSQKTAAINALTSGFGDMCLTYSADYLKKENNPTLEKLVSMGKRIYIALDSYYPSEGSILQDPSIFTNIWCDTPSQYGINNIEGAISYKLEFLQKCIQQVIQQNVSVFTQTAFAITPNTNMIKQAVIQRLFCCCRPKQTLETISEQMHQSYYDFNTQSLLIPQIVCVDYANPVLVTAIIQKNFTKTFVEHDTIH